VDGEENVEVLSVPPLPGQYDNPVGYSVMANVPFAKPEELAVRVAVMAAAPLKFCPST
jgi:hypothetical protein